MYSALPSPFPPMTLVEAGLPVAVSNPRQVRDLACATGRLAKPVLSRTEGTGPVEAVTPAIREVVDSRGCRLGEFITRRCRWGVMLKAEKEAQIQAKTIETYTSSQ